MDRSSSDMIPFVGPSLSRGGLCFLFGGRDKATLRRGIAKVCYVQQKGVMWGGHLPARPSFDFCRYGAKSTKQSHVTRNPTVLSRCPVKCMCFIP